jgi:hypothetical protein
MCEMSVDLWKLDVDAICITTNGFIKRNGHGVMGRGCALEAAERNRNAPQLLGEHLRTKGNHVGILYQDEGRQVVAFPVKHVWSQPADLDLIDRSAYELLGLADHHMWRSIAVPRPGCGNGQLDWADVKPVLERYFDDRFIVVTK